MIQEGTGFGVRLLRRGDASVLFVHCICTILRVSIGLRNFILGSYMFIGCSLHLINLFCDLFPPYLSP